MKGYITMSAKEAERITVMDNLIAKQIKQKHAARQLDISVRQVRRLMKRNKKEGKTGLVHQSRGRISNYFGDGGREGPDYQLKYPLFYQLSIINNQLPIFSNPGG